MVQAQSQSPKVTTLIQSLESEFVQISEKRKTDLKLLGQIIHEQMSKVDTARVIFVCTHNSRRSQLSEIWLRLASEYYGVGSIKSYSGGTESTAFNHRMVDAVKRSGIELTILVEGDNPRYSVSQKKTTTTSNELMFSKKYDHEYNPSKDFIAVMVCSQADKDCPFVPGASERMALPYLDPKAYDDTPQESKVYDDKVREIGREILYMMSHLAT